jgi:hypothetical protein
MERGRPAGLGPALDPHAVTILDFHADLQRVERIQFERPADQELVVADRGDVHVLLALGGHEALQFQFQEFTIEDGHRNLIGSGAGAGPP